MLRMLRKAVAVVLLSACCAMVANADWVNGGTPTSWDPNSLYANPNGKPVGPYYWNNNSGDGAQANIGWCVVGSSQCALQTTPGYMPYYSSGGSAPSDLTLSSSGIQQTFTLEGAITGQKGGSSGIAVFGYYITDASGAILNSYLLFSSTDPVGKTATPVTPLAFGQLYGFFAEEIDGAGSANETHYTFYSDTSKNFATGIMPADSMQHFAIFSSDGSNYLIGAKTSDACQGSFTGFNSPCVNAGPQNSSTDFFDFNDLVVEVSTVSTPEPASALFVCGGLLLVGWTVRRKERKVSLKLTV